jgi:hypothetical protein
MIFHQQKSKVMKKMICAAAMLLAAASLIFAQNGVLQIRATGTGNTTGHIANLSLYNPTNQTVAFTLSPCFIPSDGQYQPYIVPTVTTATVPSGVTANVPVNGYCTDISRPPVPSGDGMPPLSSWVTAEQDATAASLLEAINSVSTAFDKMKNEGSITTPFSGNPEKEREAVIQQTFWRYTSGDKYKKEDFKANTIKQFETSTGLAFEKTDEKTQSNLNAGIEQFWNTFEAIGAEAKVLKNGGGTTGGPVEISVKDKYCECGDVSFTATVYIKDPFRPEEKCKDLSLNSGSDTRDTIEHKVLPNHEVRVEITDLIPNCTECNAGQCTPANLSVTVSSTAMTDNKAAPMPTTAETKNGKTKHKGSIPARTVAPLEKGKDGKKDPVPADNPARFFITVKYDCTKEGCEKKSCPERTFEITIPRK